MPVVAIVPGSVYESPLQRSGSLRDSCLIGVAQMNDHEASETLTILFPFQLLKSYLAHPHRDSLQLLVYHIAARRGLDVDQPRNLMKSVTVE